MYILLNLDKKGLVNFFGPSTFFPQCEFNLIKTTSSSYWRAKSSQSRNSKLFSASIYHLTVHSTLDDTETWDLNRIEKYAKAINKYYLDFSVNSLHFSENYLHFSVNYLDFCATLRVNIE